MGSTRAFFSPNAFCRLVLRGAGRLGSPEGDEQWGARRGGKAGGDAYAVVSGREDAENVRGSCFARLM